MRLLKPSSCVKTCNRIGLCRLTDRVFDRTLSTKRLNWWNCYTNLRKNEPTDIEQDWF